MTAALLAYGITDLFRKPMPLWDHWWLMLLPLCMGVAIVYKAIRVDDLRHLPKQALGVFVWILLGMAAAAVVLLVIVRLAAR